MLLVGRAVLRMITHRKKASKEAQVGVNRHEASTHPRVHTQIEYTPFKNSYLQVYLLNFKHVRSKNSVSPIFPF